MTGWRLAFQSLRYHARGHIGVLIGAVLATAIITGALTVGDSVKYSLRQMALSRLGNVEVAMTGSARFFREKLAADVADKLKAPVAPAILLRGTAGGYGADGSARDTRVGNVQVVGTTPAFWRLGAGKEFPFTTTDGRGAVLLNERLARSLKVGVGDEVLLRVPKPSLLSRDAPLSTIEDSTVTLRLPVSTVLSDSDFGRFSVEANQIPPFNAFVSLETLQKNIGMEARANTLLVGKREDGKTQTAQDASNALWAHWDLPDVGLELRELQKKDLLELRTKSVFLDPPIGEAAKTATPDAQGVLTYFVNELRVGNRATPYSTVSALNSPVLTDGLRDDETVVNQWFADDVGAKVGDKLTIRYWVVGPLRRLEERSNAFTIRAILPMDGPANDPALMPDIPGLSDKKNCREWEPGVPVDLNKIRDKDQAYWDTYKGSPKAFITLKAGQTLWNNRFGNLTAVRYSASPENEKAVETCLRQTLNPASLGMYFQPVRERALAASDNSLDFGQLFLGFSMFLIVSALLLTALLFAFGIEQRAEEVGTLLAVGYRPRQVQGFLLREGALIAAIAGLLGVLLAYAYGRLVIGGLGGVWSDAVAKADLRFHAEPLTPIVGFVSGFLMALLSIWGVTRRQAQAPARDLLAGSAPSQVRRAKSGWRLRVPSLVWSGLFLVLAVGMAFAGGGKEGETAAGLFFGAGAMLLIAGIVACRALLARWEAVQGTDTFDLTGLGRRNSARRIGRSLAAIALLASGSFLVVAVGANRHDASHGAERRSSGTGGFTFYGESPLPVYTDLNATAGRDEYNLDAAEVEGVSVVALRVQDGDEASCLNLNRAQRPRLFGVPTSALAERQAFSFSENEPAAGQNPWNLLEVTRDDGAIPVIGDMNTVTWALGKSLGSTLDYTDDNGQTRKLRIVGVLANSIMQGGLILSEQNFIRLFPGQAGYRAFLVDAPPGRAEEVRTELTRGLEDVGLSLTPAAERLADFNTVENTYLSIFAVLGGLGVLLGTVGLGVIVLRNALERRAELALLRAVGFTGNDLHRFLFVEHALLLGLGLGVGILAAVIAVLPSLRTPGAQVPYGTLGLTLIAIVACGFLSTWLAATVALRGSLLPALRNE